MTSFSPVYSQGVVVSGRLGVVLPGLPVTRVVEGADEALGEGHEAGRGHGLLVKEAWEENNYLGGYSSLLYFHAKLHSSRPEP